MTTNLSNHFPTYQELTEAEVKAYSDKELASRFAENNENTRQLSTLYNEGFCTTPEYDRDYFQAKLPLDTNDALLYGELYSRHLAEIERERQARALASEAQDTIFMQKIKDRQKVA